ncbi:hypothetical protein SHM_23020 [Spiroplasma ixodetis]|uniref:Spiroplasmavirus-related protein n=1 Tax=Spiroplasma ixodetis TaxID=2141 RepID=A0ABM8BY73_9MOLU|nr:hypothetical protein SHM_23020 [Spiroplasma ixodetis]
MSNFVISILHFIFIFSSNDIGIFLNQTNITDEVYILFNLTFWLVLGVFFNFIYRVIKFVFRSLFG